MIDAAVLEKGTGVLVNGRSCMLQNATFLLFLRLAVHARRPVPWRTRAELHLRKRSNQPSRLRVALAPALPRDFQLIVGDRAGRFSINRLVLIDIDWCELVGHGDDGVAALALAELAKGRKADLSTP